MAGHRSPYLQRRVQPHPQPKDGMTGMGRSTMKHYIDVKERMLHFAEHQDQQAYDYDYGYGYDEGYYPEEMWDGQRRGAEPKEKHAPQFLAVPGRHDHQPGHAIRSPGNIRRHRSPAPVSPALHRKRDHSKKRWSMRVCSANLLDVKNTHLFLFLALFFIKVKSIFVRSDVIDAIVGFPGAHRQTSKHRSWKNCTQILLPQHRKCDCLFLFNDHLVTSAAPESASFLLLSGELSDHLHFRSKRRMRDDAIYWSFVFSNRQKQKQENWLYFWKLYLHRASSVDTKYDALIIDDENTTSVCCICRLRIPLANLAIFFFSLLLSQLMTKNRDLQYWRTKMCGHSIDHSDG